MKQKKKIGLSLLFILFSFSLIFAKDESLYMDILNDRYNFKMEFVSDLKADDVLHILYDISHLKQYLKRNMNSRLIDSDSSSYLVEFSLDKFFYKYNANFRRVLNMDSNSVDIEMIKFEQKPENLPKAIKFNGYYSAKELPNGKTKITYVQFVQLNGNGGWIFKKMVKRNLQNFAERIIEYFDELELANYSVGQDVVAKR